MLSTTQDGGGGPDAVQVQPRGRAGKAFYRTSRSQKPGRSQAGCVKGISRTGDRQSAWLEHGLPAGKAGDGAAEGKEARGPRGLNEDQPRS